MSLVIEKYLVCDVCGETDGADTRNVGYTLKQLRMHKKNDGWVYRKNRDYCDKCAACIRVIQAADRR